MNKVYRLLVIFALSLTPLMTIHSPTNAAQGDVEWNLPLHAGYYSNGAGVLAHGDDSVTVTGACANGGSTADNYRVGTFTPTSQLTNQASGSTQPSICNGGGTVGVDGTVYYNEIVSGRRAIVTVKNGVVLNTVDFNHQCSALSGGGWGAPSGVVLGTDGNVYVTIPGPNYGTGQNCSAATRLVKINGTTGVKESTTFLSPRTAGSLSMPSKMGVYPGGLIILEENVDSSGRDLLTYMSYSGVKDDTLSCAIHSSTDSCGFMVVNGEDVNYFHVNESGTVYVDTSRYVGGTCPYARRTLRYTTLGQASLIARPADCTPMNMSLLAPNDVLVFLQSNGSNITVMDTSGSTLYQGNTFSKPGYSVTQVSPLVMDGTGHVVVLRVARYGSSLDKHLYTDRLNTDGTWTTLFSTEQYANPNATDDFKYRWGHDIPSVAFADDTMYVAYCETGCSSSGGMRLAKVDSPGMSIEYPRKEVFAEYWAANGQQLDYVALGDSFSSGEGVPAFINGTASTGVNECHRSPKAYALLLDQDPALNLNLRSFRACSGATTQTLVSGQSWPAGGTPTTSNQLNSLDENTDIVTITIGGNDVEFESFVRMCLTPGTNGCNVNSVAYNSSMNLIDQLLPSRLESMLDEVAQALTVNNTGVEVFIVGYPFVVRERTTPCEYTLLGTDEQQAAENLTIALDQAIDDIVATYGDSRFNYIPATITGNAFTDHDMCSPYPYFNGASSPEVYTAHPNALGQQAYATVIKEIMEN